MKVRPSFFVRDDRALLSERRHGTELRRLGQPSTAGTVKQNTDPVG